MTKGLVSALCLSAQMVMFTPMAGATELDTPRLLAWTDHIGAIIRSMDQTPSTSFRLFNPERLAPEVADRQVSEDVWDTPVAHKSGREKPGLGVSTENGQAGLILRF